MTENLIAIFRLVLSLLPVMLVVWGSTEWVENLRATSRGWRQYAIAGGLGIAWIPALFFAGLILSPRNAPLGSWNHYALSSSWGRWNLPLSNAAVISGLLGKGSGRWLLLVGGIILVMVWAVAMVHWAGGT